MALHMGSGVISADRSEHVARLTEDGWVVSWLPDRFFSRDEAVSAVAIAEVCGLAELPRMERWMVQSWLDQLSLSPEDLRRLGRTPGCVALIGDVDNEQS